MLFSVCVMFAAMAALVEAQCPQDDFSTRNAYEVATNADGFDITLWNRAGRNLIGTIGGTLDATAGTTTVSGAATASSSDVFQNLATLDDLIENGPQTFLVLGDVDLSSVQDAHGCFLEIGDISSPGGLCMTKEGCVNFPNQFAITTAQHAAGSTTPSGTALALLVTRRASADESRIELDFEVNTNSVRVERFDRPAVAWDLDAGLTLSAPDDEDPMTTSELVFTELLVLEGRNIDVSAAQAAFNSAASRTGAKPQCLFKEYSTSAVPVVPGSGEGNLELTLTITNFGPAVEAERTASVEYAQVDNTGECDGDLMISNFTAISTSGVTFDATTFNGASQQATFAALEVGASQSFTFTATLFSNAPTTVDPPLSVPSIVIDSEVAEIYVQRRSNLVFIVDDQRRFDLKNLPIAAGCDVPFAYTIDVFNEGPSCVENLLVTSDIDTVQNCAGDADAGVVTENDIVIERIEPDTLADTDPFQFSISADADARNAQLLDRSLHLESPLDGGITAADRAEPIDSAADVTERADSTLVALNYDVTRYADVKLDINLVTGTEVSAGAFSNAVTPNIFATGTITNVGCVAVDDITVDITVDLPAGGFLASTDVPTQHTAAGDVAAITTAANAFVAAATGDAGATFDSADSSKLLRINWDGGAPFDQAPDFFGGNPVQRGLRFKSPTTRLLSSNAAGTDDDKFDSINAGIAADFQAFSGERIFLSDESNVLNVIFVEPGTDNKATVDAFGAVFVDVDLEGETKLEYYAPDEMLIGTTVVPANDGGLSFAGAELEGIARVKITLGTKTLIPARVESQDSDVVALDDFFYSRPVAAPQSLFIDGQAKHRRVLTTLPVASLAPGEVFVQPFGVFVCHQAGAEKAGVRVIAEVGRAGDNQADQHQLETATPDDDTCGRVQLVRKFDDKIDIAWNINNQAEIDVTVECEQRLKATSHLDVALDSDGEPKSYSSSSSSSSSDSDSSSSSSSSSSETSVGDIDLIKVTRCVVSAGNTGTADVPVKVEIDYVMPSGTRLAAFETTSGQFANGVWALRADTADNSGNADVCNDRNGETQTLTIDFASTSPGTLQFGARAVPTNERTEFVGGSLGEFKTIAV